MHSVNFENCQVSSGCEEM